MNQKSKNIRNPFASNGLGKGIRHTIAGTCARGDNTSSSCPYSEGKDPKEAEDRNLLPPELAADLLKAKEDHEESLNPNKKMDQYESSSDDEFRNHLAHQLVRSPTRGSASRIAITRVESPVLQNLCTKCGHPLRKSRKIDETNGAGHIIQTDLSKYIIESNSFKKAMGSGEYDADNPPWSGNVSPGSRIPPKPDEALFDRSSIIKVERLCEPNSLNGYYEINVEKLGKGSYGSVVEARDLRTGSSRAVKILHKPKIENMGRLKREILIMRKLDHPNIIRLFEVFEDENDLYLVMELCSGGELFDRIIKSGRFSERYAAVVMKQILSAIAYCHGNEVMHRDLKPENVLYVDNSPLSSLKVIDWGFAAKCTKSHRLSSVVGTPYYVAPEVLHASYGKHCDLWSAGVIMYILLSGFPPFHGKNNREILRKVKAGLFDFDPKYWSKTSDQAKNLIRHLLTVKPEERVTAVKALEHPWIRYYTQASMNCESPLTSKMACDLLERFKNFQRYITLKKLALTVVAYQMSGKDIGKLGEIFSALDKNADGVLSMSEVKSGFKSVNMDYDDDIMSILQELDTDGNGSIEYTEFIAASLDSKLYEQETVCKAAFRVFDLDGDGKITIDEIERVFQVNFSEDKRKKSYAENVVKEVDKNQDGAIDFDEFLKMMRDTNRKITNLVSLNKPRTLLQRTPRFDGFGCRFRIKDNRRYSPR